MNSCSSHDYAHSTCVPYINSIFHQAQPKSSSELHLRYYLTLPVDGIITFDCHLRFILLDHVANAEIDTLIPADVCDDPGTGYQSDQGPLDSFVDLATNAWSRCAQYVMLALSNARLRLHVKSWLDRGASQQSCCSRAAGPAK